MKEKVLVYIKALIGISIIYVIGNLLGWLDGISILPMALGTMLGLFFSDMFQWLYKKLKKSITNTCSEEGKE